MVFYGTCLYFLCNDVGETWVVTHFASLLCLKLRIERGGKKKGLLTTLQTCCGEQHCRDEISQ